VSGGRIETYVVCIRIQREGTGPIAEREEVVLRSFGKFHEDTSSLRSLWGMGVVFSPASVCAIFRRLFSSAQLWLIAGPLPFGFATWLVERLNDHLESGCAYRSSFSEETIACLREEAVRAFAALLRRHALRLQMGTEEVTSWSLKFQGDFCREREAQFFGFVGKGRWTGQASRLSIDDAYEWINLLPPHLAGRQLMWEEFAAFLFTSALARGEVGAELRSALKNPGLLLELWRMKRQVFLVPAVEPTATGAAFVCNRCGTRFLPNVARVPTKFGWEDPVCPACHALSESRPSRILVKGPAAFLSPRTPIADLVSPSPLFSLLDSHLLCALL